MRLNHIILAILINLVLSTHLAKADDLQDKQEPYKAAAQRVIDKCWAISQDDRDSGVTERMRYGTWDTARCLRDHILFLSETILFEGNQDKQTEVKTNLENIINGYGKLYWALGNENNACKTSCGTIEHITHNYVISHALGEILHDFYRKIDRYKADFPPIDTIKQEVKITP